MAFEWKDWLPYLIGGGVSAVGGIVAGKTQAGALDKASQLTAAGQEKALEFLKQVHATQREDMAPFRSVGVNALDALQNWKPGAKNVVSLADFSKFKARAASPGGGGPGAAGLAAIPPASALSGQPTFDDISTKGIHSRLGGIASGALGGVGLGGLAGGVGGGLAAAGSTMAKFGGPIGMGIGAAAGAIGGLVDTNNPDKNFATEGINRVSSWTWNTLAPAMRSGQITPDDATAAFETVWKSWEDSMRKTPGFNSGVLDRSISSQKEYFKPFYEEISRLRQPAA